MRLVDTNVLIYAHRHDAERHAQYRDWLESMINGPEPYAVSEFAVIGMLRIVTSRRIYRDKPATINEALAFAAQIRNQPHAHLVNPGPQFWRIFADLCQRCDVSGNLV